jgi:hypothetical protein
MAVEVATCATCVDCCSGEAIAGKLQAAITILMARKRNTGRLVIFPFYNLRPIFTSPIRMK